MIIEDQKLLYGKVVEKIRLESFHELICNNLMVISYRQPELVRLFCLSQQCAFGSTLSRYACKGSNLLKRRFTNAKIS